MGVLSLSGAERRTVVNQQAQTRAYAVAETGLQQFFANRAALGFTSSPAAAYESTRVDVTGGYADVVLQRIRPVAGVVPALYVLRSHGFATGGALSGTPVAERQVAQLASWGSASMSTLSAFTAINGLTKQGAVGTISGTDACGSAATIAGVAVGSPGYTQTGGASVPAGSPAILSLGTQAAAAAGVRIDWDGIVNGGAVPATVTMPGGVWPSFADVSVWPVIRVNGDFTLPGDGQGTLIVTGSLNMDAYTWKGVILVGDAFVATSKAVVQGAIVTGLNVKLGGTPAVSSLGSGQRTFQYNSCNVASAIGATSVGLSLYGNAWMDNWAGW
jgi:hypothetical protein